MYYNYMYNSFYGGPHLGILFLLLAVWSIVWKIYGVYLAARNGHKKWFVALLVLNTLGILEIIYVFKVAKKSWAEVKADFRGAFSSNK